MAPYLFVDFVASLLIGVRRCGVGILVGLPVEDRELVRGEGLLLSRTVSVISEHTDWISEISKSEASLPRRLLDLLPALLPARLGVFRKSANCVLTLDAAVVNKQLSSVEWNPFPDR